MRRQRKFESQAVRKAKKRPMNWPLRLRFASSERQALERWRESLYEPFYPPPEYWDSLGRNSRRAYRALAELLRKRFTLHGAFGLDRGAILALDQLRLREATAQTQPERHAAKRDLNFAIGGLHPSRFTAGRPLRTEVENLLGELEIIRQRLRELIGEHRRTSSEMGGKIAEAFQIPLQTAEDATLELRSRRRPRIAQAEMIILAARRGKGTAYVEKLLSAERRHRSARHRDRTPAWMEKCRSEILEALEVCDKLVQATRKPCSIRDPGARATITLIMICKEFGIDKVRAHLRALSSPEAPMYYANHHHELKLILQQVSWRMPPPPDAIS